MTAGTGRRAAGASWHATGNAPFWNPTRQASNNLDLVFGEITSIYFGGPGPFWLGPGNWAAARATGERGRFWWRD